MDSVSIPQKEVEIAPFDMTQYMKAVQIVRDGTIEQISWCIL